MDMSDPIMEQTNDMVISHQVDNFLPSGRIEYFRLEKGRQGGSSID